ncbi:MAG: 3-hydroxyacyl-CoA dehydrogenase NAD-binding domain-containing protein, partial [Perlucidibaca sp.]
MTSTICNVRQVAVIGTGTIGTSWVALFLAHGLTVTVSDIAADAEVRLFGDLERMMPSLHDLGLSVDDWHGRLRFEKDVAAAVAQADLVQENGPDRIWLKRKLWAQVERHAPKHALFLSSSSGIPPGRQARDMRNPGRLMIGHPFNPPHLIPLVEVLGHKLTRPEDIQRAMQFYRKVGKHPILLRKSVPGFVANRLQAALLREAMLMVKWDVATVDEIDDIVTHSIGLRWAIGGPFVSFHLGGGPSGFTGFLKHFAKGVQLLWLHSRLSSVRFSHNLSAKLLAQINASFGQRPMAELEAERDQRQLALLKAFAKQSPYAGRFGDADG